MTSRVVAATVDTTSAVTLEVRRCWAVVVGQNVTGQVREVKKGRPSVVIEASVVVGYVISWALRKATRVSRRVDEEVDAVLDVGLDKLHEVVAAKLGADPALVDLHEEAAAGQQVSELTRQRVELSVQAAAHKDDAFTETVAALVDQLRQAEHAGGRAAAVGQGAVAVSGDVDIHAETGGAAALQMGNVRIGYPPGGHSGQPGAPVDPHRPGRPRD